MTLKTYGGKSLSVYKGEQIRVIKQAMFMTLDLVAKASGKELSAPVLKYIIDDLIEVFSHETIEDHIEAFRRVARSKVYGSIALGDLVTAQVELQEEKSIERERFHNRVKESTHSIGKMTLLEMREEYKNKLK